MADKKFTESIIDERFYELFPYDSQLTTKEINWISTQGDLDKALMSVRQARLSKMNKKAAVETQKYWHPIQGIPERWKASLDNGTNPIIGLENVFVPAAALTMLLSNPVKTLGLATGSTAATSTGDFVSNLLTGQSVSNHIQDLTSFSKFTSDRINPLGWLGGLMGKKGANKFASKYLNKWLSKINIPIQFEPSGTVSVFGNTSTQVPGSTAVPIYYSLIKDGQDTQNVQKEKFGGAVNYLNVFAP